jgi:hypothetical protein
MTCTCRFVVALALTPLLANAMLANDAEKRSLYSSLNVLTFFTDEMKAELKITADQQRGLKASEERRNKIWQRYAQAIGKVANSTTPEREKNAKLRALETQAVDDLFKVYGETLRPAQVKRMKQIVLQVRGMEIFDYPEVRAALKIGDKEVRELRAAYDKLAIKMVAQLRAEVQAKKISAQDAARKASSMSHSVPESVRESLSKEQQGVLEDLLGEKYNYKK